MKMCRKAFTLIELLVVISIIAMLLAIITPSMNKAREQGRQAVCLTNLHAIGQGIHIYAVNYDDNLVPGDYFVPWEVWNLSRQVNLGYLMSTDSLPVPDRKASVFFCPSMKKQNCIAPDGSRSFDYDSFEDSWQKNRASASISYMFNTSLDGFGNTVVPGTWLILSHGNRIQFLNADGSAEKFNADAVVYDSGFGAELIQEVCRRYGVNFPPALLHQWFVKGRIDIPQAKAYLADPQGWLNEHATGVGIYAETSQPVTVAKLSSNSIVADVAGVWGGPGCGDGTNPPPPG